MSMPQRFDPPPDYLARQRRAAELAAAIAASPPASPARSRSTPRSAVAPVRGVYVTGYATIWGLRSRDHRSIAFAPGAFTGRLRERGSRPVKALWCHLDADVLAPTADGTLALAQDDRGLRFAMAVTGAAAARVRTNRRGLGVSPGWTTEFFVCSTWPRTDVIHAADLHEISLTNKPAIPETIDHLRVEDLD